MVKRSVVALGILGLVWALAMPAANAAAVVLLKDDFSTDALLKSSATYVQGYGTAERNDATAVPFYIHDGYLSSISADGSIMNSDGTGADENNPPLDPPSVPFMLLTGDPKWADVAVQIKMYSFDQNTGAFGVIVRATPKTKPTDPDSWYQFTYVTSGSTPGDVAGTNEGLTPDQVASGILPVTATPTLRIMKVVNNKWKLLAETDFDTSKDHIPEVNLAGVDHDASGGSDSSNPTGATFRFVAKGSLLQAFASLDGVKFTKYLEVTDDELKAGLVGLTHCDYDPIFDDLLVEEAP
jgi:hypothetical protein